MMRPRCSRNGIRREIKSSEVCQSYIANVEIHSTFMMIEVAVLNVSSSARNACSKAIGILILVAGRYCSCDRRQYADA